MDLWYTCCPAGSCFQLLWEDLLSLWNLSCTPDMPRTPRIPRMSPVCFWKCSTEHYVTSTTFFLSSLAPSSVACSRDKPLLHYDHHLLPCATVSSWNHQTVQSTVASVKRCHTLLSYWEPHFRLPAIGFSEDIISVLHSTPPFPIESGMHQYVKRQIYVWTTWCIHDCFCFSDSQCFVS